MVHRQYLNEKMFLNKPLVAFEDICELYPPHSYQMFVAIGYKQINAIKERIYKSVKESGYKCITYIHSSVRMINGGGGVSIGENVFIFENVVLQPFVTIGDNVSILPASIVCHDSYIGDHCFVASGVCINGFVEVRSNCFLGAGSIIKNGVCLGEKSLIGAGCCILKDTNTGSVYRSSDAIRLSKNSWDINL